MPEVVVPDRLTSHLAAGHPWLYAKAIPPVLGAKTGDFVGLLGQRRQPIGQAIFDGDSPIALRVVTTRRGEAAGPELWRTRIREAWALRRTVLDLTATDTFRVLHGEGDRLPGVVVDTYAGFLVVKLDTPAWLPHLDDVCAALTAICQPRGIFFKGLTGARGASEVRVLHGAEPPPRIVVREHGMVLEVDVRRGQKTGLFLDQRENRALVRRVSQGRRVLNLCAYTGGFSVAAALGGAEHVTSVDVARGAIDGAKINFAANGLDPEAHAFVVADAFAFLTDAATQRQTYDLIIVDPPSFAPNKQALRAAEAAYIRLNAAAIRQVAPGGLVACSSCSSHVPMDLFLQLLRESARVARRALQVLEVRHEPPDHPSPLHFPEGRYLKFVLCAVV